MSDKEQLKALGKLYRDAADVIDEILECEDKERENELVDKLALVMIKMARLSNEM